PAVAADAADRAAGVDRHLADGTGHEVLDVQLPAAAPGRAREGAALVEEGHEPAVGADPDDERPTAPGIGAGAGGRGHAGRAGRQVPDEDVSVAATAVRRTDLVAPAAERQPVVVDPHRARHLEVVAIGAGRRQHGGPGDQVADVDLLRDGAHIDGTVGEA